MKCSFINHMVYFTTISIIVHFSDRPPKWHSYLILRKMTSINSLRRFQNRWHCLNDIINAENATVKSYNDFICLPFRFIYFSSHFFRLLFYSCLIVYHYDRILAIKVIYLIDWYVKLDFKMPLLIKWKQRTFHNMSLLTTYDSTSN